MHSVLGTLPAGSGRKMIVTPSSSKRTTLSASTAGPSHQTGRLPALGWVFPISIVKSINIHLILHLDGTRGMRMDVVRLFSTFPLDHVDQLTV